MIRALAPEIFDQHIAVLGRTGSGKSFFARLLVEVWLEAGRRVCVVDPTDVWYGLRADSAGTGPGFPVIVFGGARGDVEIGERSGGKLAEIVGGRNLPAVIVTAELGSGERHRLMTDFLGTLYRTNRTPLHLVLDEADDLAPQNPLPENRRMLGEVDRIVRRGRVRGFRVVMISQRPAVLHKNVLAQASTLVALRLPAPQDRKAVEEWVKGQADLEQAKEMLASLSRLQRGEGWVWAPDRGVLERRQFPPISTYDSMRTPEHGETVAEPTALAPVELADLRELLAAEVALIESTKTDASREQIEAAKRREEQAEHFHFARGYAEGWRGAMSELAGVAQRLAEEAPLRPAPEAAAVAPEPARVAPKAAQPNPKKEPLLSTGLPSSAGKMLGVLATGMRLTWPQVATLAGLKARGGHFNAGRKALRDGGLVVEDGEAVAISEPGTATVGGARPCPTTPTELLAFWSAVLPSTPRRIVDQLCRQDGRWVAKDRLAEFLGLQPRGGHWNAAIAILRQNKLIEANGDRLRAAADLCSRTVVAREARQ